RRRRWSREEKLRGIPRRRSISGGRSSGRPTSRRSNAGPRPTFHNVPFGEPCGALTSCRELPELRCANCALRCRRARRLKPTCAPSTVSGRWTGQRRRVRCAAPAAFLYVCGVKKHTQLVTQRADGPVPTANPKQLTGPRESVDSPIDGRSLQIDLVRLDRGV